MNQDERDRLFGMMLVATILGLAWVLFFGVPAVVR